jgi:hypothetical protein
MKLENYSLKDWLGYGKFSTVYSAVEGATRRVVVKVFHGDGVIMRDNEHLVLSALRGTGSEYNRIDLHVPRVLHTCFTNCGKPAIILDKIGHPLQPIYGGRPLYM